MRSDSEILNLIEDFLVNNFGDDERRQMDGGEAVGMLEHIANLVDLRNCQPTGRAIRQGDASEERRAPPHS